jgi:DNA-binding SARP family transcriptional activator
MEFRLLGPLEASDRGTPVALGGRKQRALLARLLLARSAWIVTPPWQNRRTRV